MRGQGIFQADAIRGHFPGDFGENRSLALGGAVAAALGGGVWVIGRDNRLASRSLHWLILRGLSQAGGEVIDLGLCSAQMLTFAIINHKSTGGILITGGEGGDDCTGLRLWKKGAVPVGSESGLREVQRLWENGTATPAGPAGHTSKLDIHPEYLGDLMKYADDLKPFSVMADLGCGLMGGFLPSLFEKLPCELMDLADQLPPAAPGDASASSSCPSDCFSRPLALSRAVRESIADLGIVFSADGSACRFVCENGELVPFCGAGALLVSYLLEREPGAKVVCTPRDWRVLSQAARKAGGSAVVSACGSVAVATAMRQEKALLGCDGEGGYYFRDTHYAANPELALLALLAVMSREGGKVSQLLRLRATPSFRTELAGVAGVFAAAAQALEGAFQTAEATVLREEGLAIFHYDWGVWLRLVAEGQTSLLVEAESQNLLEQKVGEVERVLSALGR